ncbi:carbon-nitrogen hydrolase family protein [Pseudochelatococcus contaminans]|uniref:Putative amidohydrolase n=1 Tax=Pseudochelatococcus contaminans TaxID=1538103 RepID=A0A7W6EH51_9HYPH|nr:carbon-nitrogen hydrolase family protein [Pseudochelatococcus contaminans]MBB3809886.1 putative amidohydrolase [Pseudochelatococcus contaminans]
MTNLSSPLSIAVAQSHVTADVQTNGRHIRALMQRASDKGARLIQFTECALSGRARNHINNWHRVDWDVIDTELAETAALARKLKLWTVVGCNHRLPPPSEPHNSLYVISDKGVLITRYDKRLCASDGSSLWYTPGSSSTTFVVDGYRFGCALSTEVHYPELFAAYERLSADVVLLSSYSDEAIFAIEAQAHAAINALWVGLATAVETSHGLPGGIIGPDGNFLGRNRRRMASVVIATIDRDSPEYTRVHNRTRLRNRANQQSSQLL